MRRRHPEEYQEHILSGSLRCHLCQLSCGSSRELIEHQRAQHTQGRPFQCPVCGDSFVQSHALINHKRRHLRQSSYVCRDCAHTCRSLKQLLSHRRGHAPPAPRQPPAPPTPVAPPPDTAPLVSLQCLQCFITFKDLETSEKHLRFKHPEEYERRLRGRTVFACRRCDHTFPSSAQLAAHQRAHRTRREGERDREEQEEREGGAEQDPPPDTAGTDPGSQPAPRPAPQQHKCPHCNFLFRDVKTQERHMHAKHPPGCSAPPALLFAEEEEEEGEVLQVQIKEEPPEEEEDTPLGTGPAHSCRESSGHPWSPCSSPRSDDQYPDPAPSSGERGGERGTEEEEEEEEVLRVQIKEEPLEEEKEERDSREAPGERDSQLLPASTDPSPRLPFLCPLCGEGFDRPAAMATHRRRLHPRGPWRHACADCGQVCHSQEALLIHRRLHTEERPYLCQLCGNTFKRASGLQRHKSVHTRPPPPPPPEARPAPSLLDQPPLPAPPSCADPDRAADGGARGLSWRCQLCHIAFSDRKTRERHMSAKHPLLQPPPPRLPGDTAPRHRPPNTDPH
ncbi:oocyte zinc finger protein XlCOF28-like isoform X2 [Lepisosteus oculatus]